MASLSARVWHAFTSAVAPSTDPKKVDSAKYNADLNIFLGTICDALSKLDASPDKLPYFTSASAAAMTTLTAFGRLVVAANDSIAARALLGAVNIGGDTMTGNLTFGGTGKVTGLAAPSAATDAVRKQDLDAVVSAIAGAFVFQTDWSPLSGAFPSVGVTTAAIKRGYIFKVSADGTFGGKYFSTGDDIYALVDNPSTTTYANNWLKVEGTITSAEVEAAVGFTFGSLASLSSITASLISDASANGRSLITAANYAAMRTLLGLGSLATASSITASLISDASANGRSLIASADYAAMRTLLGLGALATAASVTVAQISNASASGRSLISAADFAAMRTLLGLGSAALLSAGTGANNVVQLDGSGKLPAIDGSQLTGLAGAPLLLHVRDEKASGTAGGTFTAGSWVTRTLNTVKTNELGGSPLSSNQVTLPAGTYEVEYSAPGYACGQHKAKLYNVTDAVDIDVGMSMYSNTSTATSVSSGRVRFTIAATKVIELRHRCDTTNASFGLGTASGFAVNEVFSELIIRKVA